MRLCISHSNICVFTYHLSFFLPLPPTRRNDEGTVYSVPCRAQRHFRHGSSTRYTVPGVHTGVLPTSTRRGGYLHPLPCRTLWCRGWGQGNKTLIGCLEVLMGLQTLPRRALWCRGWGQGKKTFIGCLEVLICCYEMRRSE